MYLKMLRVLMAAKKDPKGGGGGAAPKAPLPNAPAVAEDNGALILIGDQHDLSHIKKGPARGSENVGVEDLVIPRLEIIQSQSPEVVEGQPEFKKENRPGDLFNSVTGQNYGREVFLIPVTYNKQWLVWRSRTKGGGFRGAYPNPAEAEDRVKQEGGKDAGYEAVDTPTHLCLLVDAKNGKIDEIICSMPRTKAKISRQWNSMIKLGGGDRFSRVYRMTTQSETNDKGTFFNFVVAQTGFPAKRAYEQAEKLYEAIVAGRRNVVMDTKGYDAGGEPTGPSEM